MMSTSLTNSLRLAASSPKFSYTMSPATGQIFSSMKLSNPMPCFSFSTWKISLPVTWKIPKHHWQITVQIILSIREDCSHRRNISDILIINLQSCHTSSHHWFVLSLFIKSIGCPSSTISKVLPCTCAPHSPPLFVLCYYPSPISIFGSHWFLLNCLHSIEGFLQLGPQICSTTNIWWIGGVKFFVIMWFMILTLYI